MAAPVGPCPIDLRSHPLTADAGIRRAIAALKAGHILSAGLDVFENEPHVPPELIAMDHVVLLPHIGSASVHTRLAMGQLVVDNLVAWFEAGAVLTPVPECAALNRRV